MPRQTQPVQEVRFVRELPRRRGGEPNSWANRLMPLMEKPGVWALIYTCENPETANKLQSNLHGRKLAIPEPKHHWEFAARWCEVYAIYRGKERGEQSLRRANRGD